RSEFKDGDIIFQTSLSGQSKAIQEATNSDYSHCGIIYFEKGRPMVFEAIEPVTSTPLADWIARGKDRLYVVKRLKNADKILTPSVLAVMRSRAMKYKGKRYDKTFEWNDDRMYCSELVWKIYYEATGLQVGKLERLKDFDLTGAEVRKIMRSRYPDGVPYEEQVISPASIFSSNLLEEIGQEDISAIP
ncbi:MAG: YiiX family permuted papain-like enzyme, partial [Bacteroidota bacterium]